MVCYPNVSIQRLTYTQRLDNYIHMLYDLYVSDFVHHPDLSSPTEPDLQVREKSPSSAPWSAGRPAPSPRPRDGGVRFIGYPLSAQTLTDPTELDSGVFLVYTIPYSTSPSPTRRSSRSSPHLAQQLRARYFSASSFIVENLLRAVRDVCPESCCICTDATAYIQFCP